jgi:hypothetical protein
MLKKWECIKCGLVILAFEEDVDNSNTHSFEVIRKPIKEDCKASEQYLVGTLGVINFSDCIFKELPNFEASTMHGEAGFMTEGTVLDSMDTIHDYEKLCTEQAADARELKCYLDGMKNK